MSIFKDVVLHFKGENYTVKSNRVMGLIEVIESNVVMFDLVNPQYLKNMQIASAYHDALVYAGASCELEEVYDSLFDGGKDSVIEKINGLLSMMIPPKRLQKKTRVKKKKSLHVAMVLFTLLMLAALATGGLLLQNSGILTL